MVTRTSIVFISIYIVTLAKERKGTYSISNHREGLTIYLLRCVNIFTWDAKTMKMKQVHCVVLRASDYI